MKIFKRNKFFYENLLKQIIYGSIPLAIALTPNAVNAHLNSDLETKYQNNLQQTINGVITDQNGLPLPGANVVIKGTSKGQMSDFDGKYQIGATAGDVLVFSYVGYISQEIIVGSNNIINVALQSDTNQLDEVVVVGYGVKRKFIFQVLLELLMQNL